MVNGACIPKQVHTVVISIQHSEKISVEDLRQEVMAKVVKTVIPSQYLNNKTVLHINPCGAFVMGGPQVNTAKVVVVVIICYLLCIFF